MKKRMLWICWPLLAAGLAQGADKAEAGKKAETVKPAPVPPETPQAAWTRRSSEHQKIAALGNQAALDRMLAEAKRLHQEWVEKKAREAAESMKRP